VQVGGAHFWAGREEQGVALHATHLLHPCLVRNRFSFCKRVLHFSCTFGDTCGRASWCNAVMYFEQELAAEILRQEVNLATCRSLDSPEETKTVLKVAADAR